MNPSTVSRIRFLLTLALVSLTGCAPSRLTVRVDLFRDKAATSEKTTASHAKLMTFTMATKGGKTNDTYIIEDARADDSDAFYQTMTDPKLRGYWSTNFFFQQAKADGRTSFLIVRESPVRFSLHEAKADPTVLIKTQLRSARAGFKTVAEVARGLHPALAAFASTKPSGGGGNGGDGNSPRSTVAAKLLSSMTNTVAKFESEYNERFKLLPQTGRKQLEHEAKDQLDLQKRNTQKVEEAKRKLEEFLTSQASASNEIRTILAANTNLTSSSTNFLSKQDELVKVQKDLEQKGSALKQAKDTRSDADKKLDEAKKKVLDLEASVKSANQADTNQLQQLNDQLAAATNAVKQVQLEIGEAQRAVAAADMALSIAQNKVEELEKALDCTTRLFTATVKKEQADAAIPTAEAAVKAESKTLEDSNNRLDSLRKDLAKFEQFDSWATKYYSEVVRPSVASFEATLSVLLQSGSEISP